MQHYIEYSNANYSDTIAQIYSDIVIINNTYVNIDTIIGSQDSIIFNGLTILSLSIVDIIIPPAHVP